MSVISAIRTVCQRITRRLKVIEYTESDGDVLLTVEQVHHADGVLWEGAWVELFGSNENKRYQVKTLKQLFTNARRWVVTLDLLKGETIGTGVTAMALLLDYQFGHYKEVQQTLVEQSRDTAWKAKMYPKLILFLDITETRGAVVTASINLAIVTTTNKAFKALDREIESFDKVLHPMYKLFMRELEYAPGINFEYPIQHDKTDRYFWGSEPTPDQNVFAALLDAIEINALAIILDNKIC
jgi:hypothetical protein